MAKSRSYKLLCPIARALDRIGDRWTLLILRDLHAGPARFSDLQRGLTGIAANLLTERLGKLVDDGLIVKSDAGHGATVYELTSLGQKTGDIIFDLAVFGAAFRPEVPPVKPGNLRTVATTLGAAARRVDSSDLSFRAAVVVEGEEMALIVDHGQVQMTYGTCTDPDVILTTSYPDLLAVSEGELSPETFAGKSSLTVTAPGKDGEFMALMTRVITLLTSQGLTSQAPHS